MKDHGANPQDASPDLRPARALHVLVVDDSRMQRRILCSTLQRSGHRVSEAGDGAQALALCSEDPPDLILSDWVMPGMTGLDLCRRVRGLGLPGYIYFILLTSRGEKADVASGLDTGADDFLTKPVNADELRARIAAGQRILAMERELQRRNEVVSSTLAELQGLYDSIRRDLGEARKLQQSLVRERHRVFAGAEVSLLLQPCGDVGGDLVGFFPIADDRIAVYGVDVSGHGITSALMTARIAAHFSGGSPGRNIALRRENDGRIAGYPPEEVAARLNRMVLDELTTDNYLTLIYAEIDLRSGAVDLVQAGHPGPVILRADGQTELPGSGGLPVGLVEGARYDRLSFTLHPGDRLILVSDGFTEAPQPDGGLLGEEGAARLLSDLRYQPATRLLSALQDRLAALSGSAFEDDLSAVLVAFQPS